MIRKALYISTALALAGCAATPPPKLPAGDVPAAFAQQAPANALAWPATDWWKSFGDPQLDALIVQARTNNLDLAQATARLRQADARARQAGAALLPSIGLNGNVSDQYGRTNGVSAHETDYSLALGASYELDFWGKNRDLANAADAATAASAADRETVALTVTASVANSYFQLLSLRQRITVTRANIAASESVLKIVQRRVDAGYAAAADLLQERANMAAQRAALPVLEQQELETRSALAILLGRPPEGFDITGANLDGLATPVAAPGLPATLLTRRPDIASAEANLIAAHANLEAARTAFLPSVTLTAAGGLQYPALAAAVDTLPGLGLGATLGAALAQTIFDNGKTQGAIDEARGREEELLAAYRAAVMSALSDVENALGNTAHLAAQEDALRDQVTQNEKVLRAAQRKYQAGYADFLAVTDAERSLYAARDQLSDVRRARLTASVTLYKALGGGYDIGMK